jgi:cephalosporin-C deacetylase
MPTEMSAAAETAGKLVHNFGFDPTHGYRLEDLFQVEAPAEPPDFVAFWQERFDAALAVKPQAVLHDSGEDRGRWRVYDWSYKSTGGTDIRGWVLLPREGGVRRAFLISHGYSGRTGPDFDVEFAQAALFFPCARGLGRSRHPRISAETQWHVLHDIQSRRRYVLGGCVEDVWCGVTAILRLFPEVEGHLGYLGLSFGGGIGAMALAWDRRIQRAHLSVPTFGNHPLRLRLPTNGSAASVQKFVAKYPKARDVLAYYDAAVAARHITIPVQCACALFDPSVAPAGQFSVYNALAGPRELVVLTAGHFDHPGQVSEEARLRQKIHNFLADI